MQPNSIIMHDETWNLVPKEIQEEIITKFFLPNATVKELKNFALVNKKFCLFFNDYVKATCNTAPLIAVFKNTTLTIKPNPIFKVADTSTPTDSAEAAIGKTLEIITSEKIFNHEYGSYINSNLLLNNPTLEYTIARMNANYTKPVCIAFKKLLNILAEKKLITTNDVRTAEKAIAIVENTVINNIMNIADTSIRSTIQNFRNLFRG